jgi:hypothetical protein
MEKELGSHCYHLFAYFEISLHSSLFHFAKQYLMKLGLKKIFDQYLVALTTFLNLYALEG